MKIEWLSKVRYMDPPSLIRKLIDIGIEHELKDYAIGLFRDKKVSLGKAAEISGISKRERERDAGSLERKRYTTEHINTGHPKGF